MIEDDVLNRDHDTGVRIFTCPPTLPDAFRVTLERLRDTFSEVANTVGCAYAFSQDAEVVVPLLTDPGVTPPDAFQSKLLRLIARHSPSEHLVLAFVCELTTQGTGYIVMMGCSREVPEVQLAYCPISLGEIRISEFVGAVETGLIPTGMMKAIELFFRQIDNQELPSALAEAQAGLGMDLGALFAISNDAISLSRSAQEIAPSVTYN